MRRHGPSFLMVLLTHTAMLQAISFISLYLSFSAKHEGWKWNPLEVQGIPSFTFTIFFWTSPTRASLHERIYLYGHLPRIGLNAYHSRSFRSSYWLSTHGPHLPPPHSLLLLLDVFHVKFCRTKWKMGAFIFSLLIPEAGSLQIWVPGPVRWQRLAATDFLVTALSVV